jgi:hypothetical protein
MSVPIIAPCKNSVVLAEVPHPIQFHTPASHAAFATLQLVLVPPFIPPQVQVAVPQQVPGTYDELVCKYQHVFGVVQHSPFTFIDTCTGGAENESFASPFTQLQLFIACTLNAFVRFAIELAL